MSVGRGIGENGTDGRGEGVGVEGAGLPEPVAGSTVTATIAVCPFPSVIVTLHAVFPVIAIIAGLCEEAHDAVLAESIVNASVEGHLRRDQRVHFVETRSRCLHGSGGSWTTDHHRPRPIVRAMFVRCPWIRTAKAMPKQCFPPVVADALAHARSGCFCRRRPSTSSFRRCNSSLVTSPRPHRSAKSTAWSSVSSVATCQPINSAISLRRR